MQLFKKRIRPKTCFLLGMIGSVCALMAGALIFSGFGMAHYLQMAGFAFTGLMILFLTTNLPGPENTKQRGLLVLFFFLLLVSFLNLPPLSALAGALVHPLLARRYMQENDRPYWWLLVLFEAAQCVILTIAIMPWLGRLKLAALALSLMGVALARFTMLLRLWLHAGAAQAEEDAQNKRNGGGG